MLNRADRVPDGTTVEGDVCIVGAGAAGITLALELGRAGLRVVLLEAGKERSAGPSQRLYTGAVDDPDRHLEPDRDRTRGLGGTTAMWGGRCMPYDPIDFEARPWITPSGWPFDRSELDPFYRRAHAWVDCGPFAYDSAAAGLDGDLIDGFRDGALVSSSVERWSPPTHFGKAYLVDLKQSTAANVLLGAVAVGLEMNEAGDRIVAVRCSTMRKQRFTVRAASVVLAGGALESTRLLLATGLERPRAVGDHSGWLGRGYMTHIGGVVSRIEFNPGQRILFGYEQDPAGVYCRRRFWLSGAAQRENELVNIYALLDRPLLDDASHNSATLSLAYLAKSLVQRQSGEGSRRGRFQHYGRHIRNLLLGAPEVLTVLPRFGRQRFLAGRRVPSLLLSSRDNSFHLYFHAEQSPDRDSAVTLGQARDALGVPRLSIRFRVNEGDVGRIHRAHEVIGAELQRQDKGRLVFLGEDPRADIRACKATLGHHIGTTRMAADPENGVVDPDCRVHGVANLYVCGSATFPTSSQAHPTLTIVAMALRLSDHLAAGSAPAGPDAA